MSGTGLIGNIHTLAGYTYDVAGKSFPLTQLSYGNGNSVAYEYDDLDRIIAVRYDGETNPSVEYLYDNMGSATLRKDNIAQVQTKQLYDFADRLCRIEEKGLGSNALDHTYEWTYDQRDNVASITETLNGTNWEINFAYNADDILTQTTYGNNAFANTFDALGRQTQRTHTVSGSTRMTTTYGYINPDSAHTTTLLSTVRNRGTQFDKTTAYTYDDRGNITSVTANGSTTTFVYDNLGQLTRENNQAAGKTWTWTYDTAGNILSKSEYAYTTGSLGTALDTITYGYADSRGWGDLLTSYDGRSFQYDEIGNLLSDGEWTYTWSKGRQLASMSKPGSTLTFTYDADGNRTSKTVNGVTTTYTYVDGRVTHETNGTDTIHYRYDTNGTLLSMNLNGTEYYCLYNGQRDVIGLYDANGNVVVEYTYDAWGKPLTTTGSLASTVGAKNPYRYRGYRYDAETGLYALTTRHYNAQLGRFINADGVIQVGETYQSNLFEYSQNCPASKYDIDGRWTDSVGLNFYIGIGIYVSYSIFYSWDGHANGELQYSYGVGEGALFGMGVEPFIQWTDLDSAYDLHGPGSTTGGSIKAIGFGDVSNRTIGEIINEQIERPNGGYVSLDGCSVGLTMVTMYNTTTYRSPWNDQVKKIYDTLTGKGAKNGRVVIKGKKASVSSSKYNRYRNVSVVK